MMKRVPRAVVLFSAWVWKNMSHSEKWADHSARTPAACGSAAGAKENPRRGSAGGEREMLGWPGKGVRREVRVGRTKERPNAGPGVEPAQTARGSPTAGRPGSPNQAVAGYGSRFQVLPGTVRRVRGGESPHGPEAAPARLGPLPEP